MGCTYTIQLESRTLWTDCSKVVQLLGLDSVGLDKRNIKNFQNFLYKNVFVSLLQQQQLINLFKRYRHLLQKLWAKKLNFTLKFLTSL